MLLDRVGRYLPVCCLLPALRGINACSNKNISFNNSGNKRLLWHSCLCEVPEKLPIEKEPPSPPFSISALEAITFLRFVLVLGHVPFFSMARNKDKTFKYVAGGGSGESVGAVVDVDVKQW